MSGMVEYWNDALAEIPCTIQSRVDNLLLIQLNFRTPNSMSGTIVVQQKYGAVQLV